MLFRSEENRLTVIAAPGNVMSYAGKDDAGTAGHNSRVPNGCGDSHGNASVTFSPDPCRIVRRAARLEGSPGWLSELLDLG